MEKKDDLEKKDHFKPKSAKGMNISHHLPNDVLLLHSSVRIKIERTQVSGCNVMTCSGGVRNTLCGLDFDVFPNMI